jgi:hypothetical protein
MLFQPVWNLSEKVGFSMRISAESRSDWASQNDTRSVVLFPKQDVDLVKKFINTFISSHGNIDGYIILKWLEIRYAEVLR